MAARQLLVIVADDLTGALDTAAPFAGRGLRTRVVPWHSRRPTTELARVAHRCDVLVLETASRHLTPAAAAARVRAATLAARRLGATSLYKKIDSVWRGPILAELQAFRKAAGIVTLPVAPAFPAQRRAVIGGVLHVDGVARSTVLRDADGLELFDAAADRDLRDVARRLAATGRLDVCAGSAGLALVLAARHGVTPRPGARAQRPTTADDTALPVLAVVGSAHPAAREQLREAARRGLLVLVLPMGDGRRPAAVTSSLAATVALAQATLTAGRPVILTLPDAVEPITPGRARVAAARLAAVACEVMTRVALGTLVVVGGDTLAALVRARGATALDVEGMVRPGVALASWRRAGQRRSSPWLLTTSGGFGRTDTLVHLCRHRGRA